ncbi:hypothetical protein PCE1_002233 [Barthelona sp. PCE]
MTSVVLIPGLGGTILKTKVDNNERTIWPFVRGLHFEKYLWATWDDETSDILAFNGSHPVYFSEENSGLDAINYLLPSLPKIFRNLSNQYGFLAEKFDKSKKINRVFGLPYDWRADMKKVLPVHFHEKLSEYFDEVTDDFVLIAHSMGAPTLAYTLSQFPELCSRISSIIFVAPAFGGAPKVSFSPISGYALGLPVNPNIMRQLQSVIPNTLYLQPQDNILDIPSRIFVKFHDGWVCFSQSGTELYDMKNDFVDDNDAHIAYIEEINEKVKKYVISEDMIRSSEVRDQISELKCNECDAPAFVSCRTCKALFCKQCLLQSHQFKVFRDHELISLASFLNRHEGKFLGFSRADIPGFTFDYVDSLGIWDEFGPLGFVHPDYCVSMRCTEGFGEAEGPLPFSPDAECLRSVSVALSTLYACVTRPGTFDDILHRRNPVQYEYVERERLQEPVQVPNHIQITNVYMTDVPTHFHTVYDQGITSLFSLFSLKPKGINRDGDSTVPSACASSSMVVNDSYKEKTFSGIGHFSCLSNDICINFLVDLVENNSVDFETDVDLFSISETSQISRDNVLTNDFLQMDILDQSNNTIRNKEEFIPESLDMSNFQIVQTVDIDTPEIISSKPITIERDAPPSPLFFFAEG